MRSGAAAEHGVCSLDTGSRLSDIETLLRIAQFYHISLDELVSPSSGVSNRRLRRH